MELSHVKRSETIKTRFTEKERQQIRIACREAGKSESDFVRGIVLEHLANPTGIDRAEIAAGLFRVNCNLEAFALDNNLSETESFINLWKEVSALWQYLNY